MLTNSQVARVLGIQKIPDLLVVNLSSHDQCEGGRGPRYSYLNVRDLDDETDVRVLHVALVALPKQLCTGEGDNSLVRTILLWIRFHVPRRSGTRRRLTSHHTGMEQVRQLYTDPTPMGPTYTTFRNLVVV